MTDCNADRFRWTACALHVCKPYKKVTFLSSSISLKLPLLAHLDELCCGYQLTIAYPHPTPRAGVACALTWPLHRLAQKQAVAISVDSTYALLGRGFQGTAYMY